MWYSFIASPQHLFPLLSALLQPLCPVHCNPSDIPGHSFNKPEISYECSGWIASKGHESTHAVAMRMLEGQQMFYQILKDCQDNYRPLREAFAEALIIPLRWTSGKTWWRRARSCKAKSGLILIRLLIFFSDIQTALDRVLQKQIITW